MARASDYFVAQPDMAVSAEMIFQCCQACLAGPGRAEEEMNDPSRRWTTSHIWEGQRKVGSSDGGAGLQRSLSSPLDDRSGGSELRPQEVRHTAGECILRRHGPRRSSTRS